MPGELTPSARIEENESYRNQDARFIECQRTFAAVLGDKVTTVKETYTDHPVWNGVYRADYKIDPDTNCINIFICWFTEDGIAISIQD